MSGGVHNEALLFKVEQVWWYLYDGVTYMVVGSLEIKEIMIRGSDSSNYSPNILIHTYS